MKRPKNKRIMYKTYVCPDAKECDTLTLLELEQMFMEFATYCAYHRIKPRKRKRV